MATTFTKGSLSLALSMPSRSLATHSKSGGSLAGGLESSPGVRQSYKPAWRREQRAFAKQNAATSTGCAMQQMQRGAYRWSFARYRVNALPLSFSFSCVRKEGWNLLLHPVGCVCVFLRVYFIFAFFGERVLCCGRTHSVEKQLRYFIRDVCFFMGVFGGL